MDFSSFEQLHQQQSLDQAQRHQGAQMHFENATALLASAARRRNRSQLREAAHLFLLALKAHRNYTEAYLGLAVILHLLGQRDKARQNLQRAKACDPENPLIREIEAALKGDLQAKQQRQKASKTQKRPQSKSTQKLKTAVPEPKVFYENQSFEIHDF